MRAVNRTQPQAAGQAPRVVSVSARSPAPTPRTAAVAESPAKAPRFAPAGPAVPRARAGRTRLLARAAASTRGRPMLTAAAVLELPAAPEQAAPRGPAWI